MKKKDWENAANSLNAISSEMSEYPAIQKTIAKLKKQLDKNYKKKSIDSMLLHSLVFSIEICGISANESFKTFAKSGDIKKSYAHGLWNDTKRNNPDKIVALREQIARDLVSDHAQWMESDRAKDPPTTRSVFSRLEREDPALLYSAFREWYLESKEINNGDSIPTYEEWVKAVEMDTLPDTDILSLYKEIASSE